MMTLFLSERRKEWEERRRSASRRCPWFPWLWIYTATDWQSGKLFRRGSEVCQEHGFQRSFRPYQFLYWYSWEVRSKEC